MLCKIFGHKWQKEKSVRVVENDPFLIVFEVGAVCKRCGDERMVTVSKPLKIEQKYRI